MTDTLPVIELPVEPKFPADWPKLAVALAAIAEHDPSLIVTFDTDAGRAILKGASEAHLDSVIGHLKAETTLELTVGAPQVAYRERLTKKCVIDLYGIESVKGWSS